MKLKNFVIDEQYLTDVTVKNVYDQIKDRNNPTDDDLVRILKGHDRYYSVSNRDHDEFDRLRTELSDLGYIHIERGWWNGDRVLRPFKLNGWVFRKGWVFPCATALGLKIKVAKLHNRKTLTGY